MEQSPLLGKEETIMKSIWFVLGIYLASAEARYLRENEKETVSRRNIGDIYSTRAAINSAVSLRNKYAKGNGASNDYTSDEGTRKLYSFGINGYGNAGSGSTVRAGGDSDSESGGGGQTIAEKGSFGSAGGGGWGGASSGGVAATKGVGHGIGFGSSLTNPYSEGRVGNGWGGGRAGTQSLGFSGGNGGGVGSSGSSAFGSALSSSYGLGTGSGNGVGLGASGSFGEGGSSGSGHS